MNEKPATSLTILFACDVYSASGGGNFRRPAQSPRTRTLMAALGFPTSTNESLEVNPSSELTVIAPAHPLGGLLEVSPEMAPGQLLTHAKAANS